METSKQASRIQHCTKINSAKDKWFANTQEFRLPVDKTIDRFMKDELSAIRKNMGYQQGLKFQYQIVERWGNLT